jgi:hypothetical protein
MPEHNISTEKLQSKRALLGLLGHKIREAKLLEPFHRLITIKQKTLVHSPTDKLQDCLVGILMGNTTLYETNTTLSTEQAFWQSWGRSGCTDQSTIQRTLEECSQENVNQLHQVNALFLKQVGQSVRHDFSKEPLILDGDLTGLPCSKIMRQLVPVTLPIVHVARLVANSFALVRQLTMRSFMRRFSLATPTRPRKNIAVA